MKHGHAQTVRAQASRGQKNLKKLCWLFLIALLLPILSLLTGCAGLVSGAKQTSSVASFKLSPSSVNFGQVVVGKQAAQTVSVSNTGSETVNLKQMTLSNPQFSVTGMTTPMALAVGQTGTFTVAVNPTSTGTLTGTLTAQDDGGGTPVVVKLSATAVHSQSQLSLNSTSINFGTVSTGLKATNNLVLTNSGTTGLTISLLTLTGADFTISGITTPETIPPGQSVQVAVSFSPTLAGNATGSLNITSNDPTNPTVAIPLSGTGTSAATGRLSANQTSLGFGAVAIGTSADQQMVLTNTGNTAVKISSLTVVGAGLTATGVPAATTLNPSGTISLRVSFQPTAVGSISGSITIVSDAANSPLTIPVSGTGAQSGLALSPANYNFGNVVDGQTKSQSFTVTNTGAAALTIGQLSVSGSAYSVSGVTTPLTLAPGSNTSFSVLFAPTTEGSLTGTVTILSNAPNSPNVASLSGTGTAATVTLTPNPSSVSFANVNAGSSSSKSVTITNTGNTSLTISQIGVSAKDFKVTGITAPATLAAGQNAAMSVSFNPTVAENISGNIIVMTAEGASAAIAVSGTALQPGLTMTPASASFGSVTVGSPATQSIQLTNSGTGTLTLSQVSVTGSGFSTGTLSLPLSLNSGQSTNITAQFAPISAGTVAGSLTIVSNAPNSPAVVALSGTGIAATQVLTFSATNLGFGTVTTGSSATQNITVTNSGNASVNVSQITESGTGFTLTGGATPVTLASGQALTFGVVFSPSAAGNDTGNVSVTSSATATPTTILLSGTGIQPASHTVTLSWTASTSTVSGYNVYRSATNGSGYVKINSSLLPGLSYEDTAIQSGTTYYYVATAVDPSGNESSDSNQATAVIP
jgi:hypothetical protein